MYVQLKRLPAVYAFTSRPMDSKYRGQLKACFSVSPWRVAACFIKTQLQQDRCIVCYHSMQGNLANGEERWHEEEVCIGVRP